ATRRWKQERWSSTRRPGLPPMPTRLCIRAERSELVAAPPSRSRERGTISTRTPLSSAPTGEEPSSTPPPTSSTGPTPSAPPGARATRSTARGTDTTSDLTVNAVLANMGTILKTGNGIMTLTAQNTYVGGTTVNAGTLVLNDTWNGVANSWPGIGVVRGNLVINSGATVVLNSSGNGEAGGALGWAVGRL
ncbi:MAG: hypothetical protein EBV01_14610, partial [Betaproteobacteria bacterium]|nr:hypothetical protein [Betaproteobacteria bacterium]